VPPARRAAGSWSFAGGGWGSSSSNHACSRSTEHRATLTYSSSSKSCCQGCTKSSHTERCEACWPRPPSPPLHLAAAGECRLLPMSSLHHGRLRLQACNDIASHVFSIKITWSSGD
jgi:hypothetical protein